MSSQAPRILLVTPVSPWGPSSGTQQRTALLHAALSALAPVDVLIVEEGRENKVEPGERAEILARLSWKQPALALYKYGAHEWIDRWCQSNLDWSLYQLVVGRYLTPVSKVRYPSHLPTIVDCDDAFYWYPPAREGVLGRAMALARTWTRYLQTRLVVRKYDHVFFCSRRDFRSFEVKSGSVLPNAVRVPAPELPPPGHAETALIVGSMWYPPNRLGVDWFLDRCWPEIARECPNLSLRIVGAGRAEDRARWSRAPRTAVLGYVNDLADEYARALFAIAPINFGGGACIKFIEAAAFGRPCVVTGHVFSAFEEDFLEGQSVVVAKDARRMIQQCLAVFASKALRDAVARQARETVVRGYTVERFHDVVHEAVHKVLGSGGLRRDPAPEASRGRRERSPTCAENEH